MFLLTCSRCKATQDIYEDEIEGNTPKYIQDFMKRHPNHGECRFGEPGEFYLDSVAGYAYANQATRQLVSGSRPHKLESENDSSDTTT